MSTFGKALKHARVRLGYKQKDVETLTGVRQKYLSRIENDAADPGLRIVLRLAKALQVDLNALLSRDET